MPSQKNAPFFILILLVSFISSCTVYQNDGRKNFESDIITNQNIDPKNLNFIECNGNEVMHFQTALLSADNNDIEYSSQIEAFNIAIANFNSAQAKFLINNFKNQLLISSQNNNQSCLYDITDNFSQHDLANILRGLYESKN